MPPGKRGLPTDEGGGDIAGVTNLLNLLHRLNWLNIAAFLLPAIALVWLDRRAGRRTQAS